MLCFFLLFRLVQRDFDGFLIWGFVSWCGWSDLFLLSLFGSFLCCCFGGLDYYLISWIPYFKLECWIYILIGARISLWTTPQCNVFNFSWDIAKTLWIIAKRMKFYEYRVSCFQSSPYSVVSANFCWTTYTLPFNLLGKQNTRSWSNTCTTIKHAHGFDLVRRKLLPLLGGGIAHFFLGLLLFGGFCLGLRFSFVVAVAVVVRTWFGWFLGLFRGFLK